MLCPYVLDYAITDSLVQQAQDCIKLQLFGTPLLNVMYAAGVAELITWMVKLGMCVIWMYDIQMTKHKMCYIPMKEIKNECGIYTLWQNTSCVIYQWQKIKVWYSNQQSVILQWKK